MGEEHYIVDGKSLKFKPKLSQSVNGATKCTVYEKICACFIILQLDYEMNCGSDNLCVDNLKMDFSFG